MDHTVDKLISKATKFKVQTNIASWHFSVFILLFHFLFQSIKQSLETKKQYFLSWQTKEMYILRSLFMFTLVVSVIVLGSMIFVILEKLVTGNKLIDFDYILQYKSIVSILILLITLLLLLLLAITCTYTRFMSVITRNRTSDVGPRSQIFFNLIQYNLNNLAEDEENVRDLIYDANPPDYTSVVSHVGKDFTMTTGPASRLIRRESEAPPSYELAVIRVQKDIERLDDNNINNEITSIPMILTTEVL